MGNFQRKCGFLLYVEEKIDSAYKARYLLYKLLAYNLFIYLSISVCLCNQTK